MSNSIFKLLKGFFYIFCILLIYRLPDTPCVTRTTVIPCGMSDPYYRSGRRVYGGTSYGGGGTSYGTSYGGGTSYGRSSTSYGGSRGRGGYGGSSLPNISYTATSTYDRPSRSTSGTSSSCWRSRTTEDDTSERDDPVLRTEDRGGRGTCK